MELYIETWRWDDENIEHLYAHGITPEMVEDEIWENDPRFFANRGNRSASHKMIGPDHSGRLWTVCIKQSGDSPGEWRAITGWQSTKDEATKYRRAR